MKDRLTVPSLQRHKSKDGPSDEGSGPRCRGSGLLRPAELARGTEVEATRCRGSVLLRPAVLAPRRAGRHRPHSVRRDNRPANLDRHQVGPAGARLELGGSSQDSPAWNPAGADRTGTARQTRTNRRSQTQRQCTQTQGRHCHCQTKAGAARTDQTEPDERQTRD